MSSNFIIDDDAFLFAGQTEGLNDDNAPECLGSWRILIVDDEPEVHKVTELALNDLNVLGRKLDFVSVYSREEAIEFLKSDSDIAVILLDVVMETDDAGLKAVIQIRDELELHDVRIILRTGQPGYAPEEQVVTQYDINDYRTKTELTRNKLLTSVFSAVRSYSQIVEIKQSRDFLDKLTGLNNRLLSQGSVRKLAATLVNESVNLFKSNDSGLLAISRSDESNAPQGYWIEYGCGEYDAMADTKYEKSLPVQQVSIITEALNKRGHVLTDNYTVLYIKGQSSEAVLLLNTEQPIEISVSLLNTFTANVASSLDNSLLLRKVSDIAYVDKVTCLPNRAKYIQLLDEFTRGNIKGNIAALIDLDHFSDINDGLGLEIGNSLLNSVAERLKYQLDDSVLIARVGADIFGLIGDDSNITPEILESLFEKPFNVEQHIIPVKATFGICRKDKIERTGLGILKQENIALNRAKRDIKSRCQFYNPEMEDETSWRLSMIRRLSNDFKQNKLQLWYQPQFSAQHGQIIGMEALLRWPDGNGGYISPVAFIPLAEYSGLIVDIGDWVLQQACTQLRELNELGFSDLRMAINVSMPQFRSSTFVDTAINTLKQFDYKPGMVELEITESVVMDDPQLVIDGLRRLKESGFNIAIDDFGTGFSSLSYLRKLPLDQIKVDREFIKDIGEGGDGIIAESIIHLGQKLGLTTIAEGVETEYQLNYIRELGCDEVQGYLKAKPMPADELKEYLKTLDN
ncbi:MAG: EAL domain-containing protein [Gammaproteobacteria bacterium]|nr:EAL domain-containing protein [Gammaproteobacteria bacterium]